MTRRTLTLPRCAPLALLALAAVPARAQPAIGTGRGGLAPAIEGRDARAATHTVAAGDTLWTIAGRLGTTVEELRRANRLTSDVILPGDVLAVPGAVAAPTGPVGAAPAPPRLDGAPGTSRAEVDAAIALAIGRERVGQHDEAVAALQAAALRTGFADPKARYFLARSHLERARARAAADPAGARADRAAAAAHLRAVPSLAATTGRAEDRGWAAAATSHLRARARSTPVLDQRASGRYPWGYCGIAALRMVLRLEGLADPGADAVALRGAAPYIPGAGSDPSRLAARARELGLSGASFRNATRLADITTSVDGGRPVLVGGIGPFSARLDGGGTKARTYPAGHWLVVTGWEPDARGQPARLQLNDPDGGHRLTMTRAEFLRFFAPQGDGSIWAIRYSR